MPVLRDMMQSFVRPRAVIARKLADGPREDRAIATLFGACGLLFVTRLPARAREAHLQDTSFERLFTTDLYALLFILPLILYGLAAVTHIVAMPLRGRGSWFGARVALFWALFASAPLLVLNGLVGGLIGPGLQLDLVGALWLVAFLWLWVPMYLTAEWNPPAVGEAPAQ